MSAPALGAIALHDLLSGRSSPRAFDPGHALADAELVALLEAARWAPSSSNTQPWRFLVGRRGDSTFASITSTLAAGNLAWAPRASALLLVVAETADAEGRLRTHALYDLGQAVAHLSVQAEAMGLAVRQIGGFSVDRARAAFGLPEGVEPVVVVAVGQRADASTLPEQLAAREAAPRVRKPLEEIALARWGKPLLR